MIVYLDASALVKRYVQEAGSAAVGRLVEGADLVGTAAITRVEMAAALDKAVRVGVLSREEAALALEVFREEWSSLVRIQVTEPLLRRAEGVAWHAGLRGYDATHLAAALFWQEMLGEPVAVATFDRQLWDAARRQGMRVYPEERP